MLKNQIKVAIRSLFKNKLFSLINIFGLSISMSVCLLVIMLITDQYSSDRHNPDRKRIFRINTQTFWEGKEDIFASAPIALANVISEGISDVEKVAVVRKRFGGDAITQSKIVPLRGIYANEHFFDVLHFSLAYGVQNEALTNPYSVVLTQSAAIKLFGNADAIGKTLSFEENGEYTVTGILADSDNKSHITNFEAIASLSTLPILQTKGYLQDEITNWNAYYQSYVYLLFRNRNSIDRVNSFITEVSQQHYSSEGVGQVSFALQPLTQINPAKRQLSNEFFATMPLAVLFILSGISLLIMFTAAFNYTNLSLAKAMSRTKEIGIRKVSGASNYQLFIQFILESILISFLALFISYGLLYILIPGFFSLDPNLSEFIAFRQSPQVWLYFVFFSVVVGFLGGILPAVYLSKLKPVIVLKNFTRINFFQKINLRKGLIILQFTLSLIFILSSIIFYHQFTYALDFDLGYDKENILNVELHEHDFDVIKTEFSKVKEVENMSGSAYVLGLGILYRGYMRNPDSEDSLNIAFQTVSHNYPGNLGHEFKAGDEVFQKYLETRQKCVVINENLVKSLGFEMPIDAIGRMVKFENTDYVIAGVTRDFYYTQIDRPIDDFAFIINTDALSYANLRIKSDNMKNTIASLAEVWAKIDNQHEFSYYFYDDQIKDTYTIYMIWSKIIGFISFLAISIACVGLFGMAIYASESRIKEIGIRKTLGADVAGLIFMLSKGFIKLIIISSLIAVPLAWIINEQILSNMANRTPITFFMIGKGVILMLLLGIITIGSQTYRAAAINPAQSLRSE